MQISPLLLPVQWNLSWETTVMRDHLSWRTTCVWQKVTHFNVNEPVTKDHLSETIFLWSTGAVFQDRFYCTLSLPPQWPASSHRHWTPHMWSSSWKHWICAPVCFSSNCIEPQRIWNRDMHRYSFRNYHAILNPIFKTTHSFKSKKKRNAFSSIGYPGTVVAWYMCYDRLAENISNSQPQSHENTLNTIKHDWLIGYMLHCRKFGKVIWVHHIHPVAHSNIYLTSIKYNMYNMYNG